MPTCPCTQTRRETDKQAASTLSLGLCNLSNKRTVSFAPATSLLLLSAHQAHQTSARLIIRGSRSLLRHQRLQVAELATAASTPSSAGGLGSEAGTPSPREAGRLERIGALRRSWCDSTARIHLLGRKWG